VAFIGNGAVDGRIELANMLRKRRYPEGKVALRNLSEHFENRIKTLYKDAPVTWKEQYTKAVFGGIEDYKTRVAGGKPRKRRI
jgi:hypothetical protein